MSNMPLGVAIAGCGNTGSRSTVEQPAARKVDSGMSSTSRTALDGMGSPSQVFGSARR